MKSMIKKCLFLWGIFYLMSLFGGIARAQEVVIPDELKDDRNLPREERILRHQKRVQLILEQRTKEKEEERKRQLEEAHQKAREAAETLRKQQMLPPRETRPSKESPREGAESLSIPVPTSNIMASTILHFYPFDVTVKMGDKFLTDLQILNTDRQGIEELRIKITYDSRFIIPILVNDSEIAPLLKTPALYRADNERGEIMYECTFKTPQVLDGLNILRIVWKALKTTDFTEIGFDLAGGETALKAKGKDILGIPVMPMDGVIPTGVTINSSDKKGEEKIQVDPSLENLVRKHLSEKPAQHITLCFKCDKKTITIGEMFDVSIILSNPDAESFDCLALYMRFDPDVLRVVDWDKGNWITLWTNIQDGFARRKFPFDYHLRNNADNYLGRIEYRMGTSQDSPMPSGEFARIRFRAIASAEKTNIFFVHDKGARFPNTSVSSLGQEILSDEQWTNPLLSGIIIQVNENK